MSINSASVVGSATLIFGIFTVVLRGRDITALLNPNLEKSLFFIKKFEPKKAILTNLSPVLDYNELKKKLPKNVIPAHDGLTINL